jgi:hypothetical protein
MDDDEKDGVKRAEASRQSKKSIEEVLKRVARPAWRSPLFWLAHRASRRVATERGGDWAQGALARALRGLRRVGDNAG